MQKSHPIVLVLGIVLASAAVFLISHNSKGVLMETNSATSTASARVVESTRQFYTPSHFQQKEDTVVLDKTTFETGISPSNETSVPDNATIVKVVISREGLPAFQDEVIKVTVDLYDGVQWISNFMGFGAVGGALKDRNGQAVTSSSVYRKLPAGIGRKIKLQIDAKAELKTLVSVEFQ